MNAKKGSSDKYCNVAFSYVAQTVINTLVFEAINMAVGLFQGTAMVLHRLEFYPNSIAELQISADDLQMALVTSNRLAAIADVSDPAVVSLRRIQGIGAATTTERAVSPITADYSTLPGGGKLLPASSLYAALNTAGFAAVTGFRLKMEFTFIQLAPEEYLEVIQSMFPANVA